MKTSEKSLNTKIRIGLSLFAMLSMLVTFNQCVGKNTSKKKSLASSSVNAPDPSDESIADPDEHRELPEGLVMPPMNAGSGEEDPEVGVKNYEQINMTMAELTGVSPADTNVARVYAEVEMQLPTDNSIRSFSSAQQIAITKLAAEYCNSLVDNTTLRTAVWPNFNFGGRPSDVLNTAGKGAIIDRTILHFMRGVDANATTTIVSGGTTTTNKQDSVNAFSQTLYTTTRMYCASCHTTQNPAHASANATTAHDSLINTNKIDFNSPANSGIVTKVRNGHNCWGGDCNASANILAQQITNWKNLIPRTVTTPATESTTSIKNEFVLLIEDLLAGESMTDSAVNRKVVKGLCTTALSSAQVMML